MPPEHTKHHPDRSGSRKARGSSEAADAVEALLSLVDGTRIADIEVEIDGTQVRVKREPSTFALSQELALQATADDAIVVTSVYVGIFHREPASAFPALGDHVKSGQTIAHVETLRVQNTVVATAEGILVELLVADGTPVEYGQPLAVVRPGSADDDLGDAEERPE